MVVPTVGEAVMLVPVPPVTFRTSVPRVAVPPEASGDGLLQVIVPVPPTAGVMQVQPAGGTPMLWNVVPAGIVREYVGFAAAIGPLLVMTWL